MIDPNLHTEGITDMDGGGNDTADPTPCDVRFGRLAVTLFPGGVVWWASMRTVLVADTHLGKEATFRRSSIPVPVGSTRQTLDSLSEAVERLKAERVIVLGDLFHDRLSLSEEIRGVVEGFWSRHADVRFVLVRGNHDVSVGRLPMAWPIEDVGPRWTVEGDGCRVELAHLPADPAEGVDVLMCGHLHPAVQLRGFDPSLGKVPCYWHAMPRGGPTRGVHDAAVVDEAESRPAGGTLVLPAAGDFTGTAAVRPTTDDAVWLCAGSRVVRHRTDVRPRTRRRSLSRR